MRCPFCSHLESKVTDSRNAQEMSAVKRRRECLHCQKRFTTFEQVDLTIQVEKRDGTFEEFSQEKLIKGLDAACTHTKVSHGQVRALSNQIMQELVEKQIQQINTKALGQIVMDHLKKIDMIAYIRFACVYKRFKDIKELVEAIQNISSQSGEEKSNKKEIDHVF